MKEVSRNRTSPEGDRTAEPIRSNPSTAFPVVGVGASAGGMEAFIELLGSSPGQRHGVRADPAPRSDARELPERGARPVDELPGPRDRGRDARSSRTTSTSSRPTPTSGSSRERSRSCLGRRRRASRTCPSTSSSRPSPPIAGTRRSASCSRGRARTAPRAFAPSRRRTASRSRRIPDRRSSAACPSAVKTGVVDFALPIPELAAELVRISRHPFVRGREAEVLASPADDGELKKILVLLRNAVGVDFSEYKLTSIRRRLARRMALHRLTSARRVRAPPPRRSAPRVQALFEDILIHVTSFFRDGDVFEKLKEHVFPEILKQKRDGRHHSHLGRRLLDGRGGLLARSSRCSSSSPRRTRPTCRSSSSARTSARRRSRRRAPASIPRAALARSAQRGSRASSPGRTEAATRSTSPFASGAPS